MCLFFVGSDRQPTTQTSHTDMDLTFPIPVIGKVSISTHKSQSIQIYERPHTYGKLTVKQRLKIYRYSATYHSWLNRMFHNAILRICTRWVAIVIGIGNIVGG